MRKTTGMPRSRLFPGMLAGLLVVSACANMNSSRKQFNVRAQSAAPALNEFARQADITLIFSYDLVAGRETRDLKGRHTVENGLTILLDGTQLAYRQAADGAYFICQAGSCERSPAAHGSADELKEKTDSGGGKRSATRLHIRVR